MSSGEFPGETEYAKISDYDTRTWVEYPTTVHGSYQFRVNARGSRV